MKATRYTLELLAALALYATFLVISLKLVPHLTRGSAVQAFVSLSPVLPALGVCWAVMRGLRRMDEMQRKIQVEALGVAFAATAIATFSYGFLENVGYPKLSMFTVWPLMALFWVIAGFISSRRHV